MTPLFGDIRTEIPTAKFNVLRGGVYLVSL